MTTLLDRLETAINGIGMTEALKEQIRDIFSDYGKQEHENGYAHGYENARIELYNTVHQEGYDKGRTDGEQLGRDHAIDDIRNDALLPVTTRTKIIEYLRG
jgi:flagellar biosynthesis/type III secretory pathway protein FliH